MPTTIVPDRSKVCRGCQYSVVTVLYDGTMGAASNDGPGNGIGGLGSPGNLVQEQLTVGRSVSFVSCYTLGMKDVERDTNTIYTKK
jgi:hypothetical protein